MEGQATASNASQPQHEDFDFWEFVTCAKCHLNFSSDGVSTPTVPFWLTECGHIICNSHLNADQSCPSCKAQGIELMPLQKELPPPMSDWFCSVPFKLDALAQTAKFQHESLAASVRYYKNRTAQYRVLLERMKNDVADAKVIKKENEALRREMAQLRNQRGPQEQEQNQQHKQHHNHQHQEPGEYLNANGKRFLVDHRISTSSPRSIHTPLGPPRITLPPEHNPPPSFAKSGDPDSNLALRSVQQAGGIQVPGSSHFVRHYAYNPPQTQQTHAQAQQVLSHIQQAPVRQRQAAQMQNQSSGSSQNDRRLMPPPPTPVRSKLQQNLPRERQVQHATSRISISAPTVQDAHSFTPRRLQQQMLTPAYHPVMQGELQAEKRTLGQTPRQFVPSTPISGPRRFAPPTPMEAQQNRPIPSSAGTRAVAGFPQGHAQRTAFSPSM
ncbi:hypothetical protein M0805_002728 [Coniferiporia weirii]|nr:hypothetical protein M0805_002728 [Coniferiporia weirii]